MHQIILNHSFFIATFCVFGIVFILGQAVTDWQLEATVLHKDAYFVADIIILPINAVSHPVKKKKKMRLQKGSWRCRESDDRPRTQESSDSALLGTIAIGPQLNIPRIKYSSQKGHTAAVGEKKLGVKWRHAERLDGRSGVGGFVGVSLWCAAVQLRTAVMKI